MNFFNRTFPRAVVFMTAGALGLTGCFKPQTKDLADAEASFATFKVEEVKGSSEVTGTVEGFSIPAAKKFTFKTCMTDRKIETPVADHDFVVEGTQLSEKLRSDAKGCVSWSESFEFNYVADETYLTLKRTLRAVGLHSGRRELKIAINPWNFSGKQPEIVDLSKGGVEGAIASEEELAARLDGQIKPTRATPKKLSLGRFELVGETEINTDPAAPFVKVVSMLVHPQLLLQDLKGQSVEVPLKEAKLQLTAALVVAGGGKQKLAWASEQPVPLVREAEGYRADLRLTWGPAKLDNARYLLVLKLATENGPEELESFEGAIDLGSHSQLLNSSILPEKLKAKNTAGTFSFDESIKGLEKLEPEPVVTPAPVPAPAPAPVPGSSPAPAPAPGGSDLDKPDDMVPSGWDDPSI